MRKDVLVAFDDMLDSTGHFLSRGMGEREN
jgi:hypothetical protein